MCVPSSGSTRQDRELSKARRQYAIAHGKNPNDWAVTSGSLDQAPGFQELYAEIQRTS